jgi:S-methylmethionine-dependent homocysteine/selenocysteine methylase
MQQNEVEALLNERPQVLDGATGTELEHRGISTALPLWSASALWEHPEIVREIHADYARAGADLLTANTFRTQRRTLARAGRGNEAESLTQDAVTLAREGARTVQQAPRVLGSAPTLEDCYRPEDVPEPAVLAREHREHAENLARAGVDAILIETMNCIREARAAIDAARAVGLPFLVSFVCWDGAHLLSGEPLQDAISQIADSKPWAVAVNCLPLSNTAPCINTLAASGLRFGAYANLGEPADESGFARSADCSPARFAYHASAWIAAGASVVGGCCGTTPAHIEEISRRLRAD